VFVNQGPLAITFFEVTALIVLLVLFLLLRRDHPDGYFRLWLAGWVGLTLSSAFEVGLIVQESPELRLAALATEVVALLLFLSATMQLTVGGVKRNWPVLPVVTAILAGVYYVERSTPAPYFGKIHWETAALESAICLWAGWLLWRARATHEGHGARLLAGSYYGQTIQIWAALLASAILASGLIGLVDLAERIVGLRMGARP